MERKLVRIIQLYVGEWFRFHEPVTKVSGSSV